ncbi:MAG: fatty oxidation complex subunit alpha [Zetaproteobacteria bacterium]|nr:MAG: fatty oxidation complex subunit alpha [Zetaproteobacteria bacterium]
MTVALIDGDPPRLRFSSTDGPNLLDGATMEALEGLLDRLEADPPELLCIDSADPRCFLAGADIHEIEAVGSADQAEALAQRGQAICQRLHALPSTTIAIVSGSCLGGGLELALACDYIVALEHPATRLGLPEVKIGIHPGFGGCLRLPQRVGWPQAVAMISSGRTLDPRQARRIGLADCTCRAGAVERAIAQLAARGKRRQQPPAPWWFRLWPARRLFFLIAERRLAARFPHLDLEQSYPALPALLSLMGEIYGMSDGLALAREAESLGRLACKSPCKHLVRAFFLGNRLKKLEGPRPEPPAQVAVYGAGVMGHGIAWVASKAGRVDLHDLTPPALGRALKQLARLDRTGGRRLERIRPACDDSGLAACSVVIEAVVEDLEAKQALWRRIEPLVAEDALLLSNTSSLPISDQQQALAHPERMAGLHFFNPAPKMPLVEVIAGAATAPETIERVRRLAVAWGKYPVVVADRPGFLVNRCLLPMIGAAFALIEAGEQPQHIDGALKRYGMPMGALELADRVGLDICLHVGDELGAAWGARMAPPDWLRAMVEGGLLGKKQGGGFYRFPAGRPPQPNPAAAGYYGGRASIEREFDANMAARRPPMAGEEIVARCLLPLVIEALRCLDEGIVADRDTLDGAMLYGIGYPPFRGGPLHDFANHHDRARLQQQAEAWGLDGAPLLERL